jgi:hypothetical protein
MGVWLCVSQPNENTRLEVAALGKFEGAGAMQPPVL